MRIKADKSYIGIVTGSADVVEVKDADLVGNGVPLRQKINVGGSTIYVFMPVTLGGVEIKTPIVSIDSSKNIIKTDLASGNGSVKELVNINDYNITITGAIIGEKDYPVNEVQELVNLYNRNEALDISNALTELVMPSGTKVVITNLSLPTVQGFEHVQPFTMNLQSDFDFSLYA